MALDFETGSSQYATDSALPVSGVPLTFAMWFKPENVTVLQALMALGDSGGSHRHQLELTASATLLARSVGAANATSGAPATTLTAGQWHHCAGVWASSTSRTSYVDGVAGTTNGTSVLPSGIDSLITAARYSSGALGAYADGFIAERAIWDVALTAAEIEVLAKGYSPLFVRPASLVSYCQLIGNNSPEIDLIAARTLTLTNTPVKADHPRILRPSSKIYTFPSADGSLNITAGVDALTLAEAAATVGKDLNIAATRDQLTLAEYVASITDGGLTISATCDALTLAEYSASIGLSKNVLAGVDALTLAEYQASLAGALDVQATCDALTLAESAATIGKALNVLSTADALTLAELRATITTQGSGSGWSSWTESDYQLNERLRKQALAQARFEDDEEVLALLLSTIIRKR